ncbi:hypothetical protein FNV43_RR05040 [Rhamnella rubrinervis]|uniref:Stress response NST1-like protein n=1 Tax=Rhamnella rubrinervis TaxID=2594499 RepID=A0A8K0HKQ2_9ROSA|nr:hypothetical protein FNV43_RR05040 [Rhamnella rubrinervis]
MELETPPSNGKNSYSDTQKDLPNPRNGETNYTHEPQPFSEDIDSTCSTPYVSAPSSPGRGTVSGFFYSAPASPMHSALTSTSLSLAHSSSSSLYSAVDSNSVPLSFEFEFSARFGSNGSTETGSMSSADELFLNGQIRPMKLSTHLERPQVLAPLLDLDHEGEEEEVVELAFEPVRGRDLRLRDKSLRRRARSMSPLKTNSFEWTESEKLDDDGDERFSGKDNKVSHDLGPNKNEEEALSSETTPSVSVSSSRSSSAGRNSKRWVFLKDFLYRSKSEGRSNNKFWSTISFSPAKEKKPTNETLPGGSVSKEIKFSNPSNGVSETQKEKGKGGGQSSNSGKKLAGKPANGVGKRRVPPSPHELHYTKNRAQAEELRKKTYLPYRQGLLGCLGFSSKGYGAMNGFARALNPVSSR